ncbi:MAG: adenylate/guanylate cyclase domain-containing protein [bacterium]
MSKPREIAWYKKMGFRLATLVAVSILAFSCITLLLQARRVDRLYSIESTDCKIKLSTALEKTIRDYILPGDTGRIAPYLDRFVEQNPDVAYICIASADKVIISSSGKGKCPGFPYKKELSAYSTNVMRVYRIEGQRRGAGYLETMFYLSPDRRDLGYIRLGFYEMDATAAERFRKVIGLERYISSNVEGMISNFSFAGIDRLAADMAGGDTNIRYVIVTDGDFQTLFHPDSKKKFIRLTDSVALKAENTGPFSPIMIQYVERGGDEIMDVAMGMFSGGQRIGGIRIGYSLRAQKQRTLISGLQLALIVFLLVGIALTLSVVIARRISAPVVSLSETALKVGSGDLESNAVYQSGGEEMRLLYESFNQMISGLKERDFVKDTFSRYVTKQVAEEILKNPSRITPGGKNQEVTVLFSDIRGFTTFAEGRPPEQVLAHLNEYLSAMVDIIFKYEGTLDKFIGDAVMAVFGSPIAHDDDPLRAAKTALEMHERLKILNEQWAKQGKETLEIGVGVNTGEVIAGNIGDIRRLEYTVIGDNVNLASRIEGLTKEYHCPIIISESAYAKIKEQVVVKKIGYVPVKGKTQEVEIFELISLK